jgi:ABC-type Zn uptake system ZnuABC Zn-binding protein ZnuA
VSNQHSTLLQRFLPITLFTEAVAGECATVTALIPPNLGPHDFQATPPILLPLAMLQSWLKNGLGMEYFLDKLTESAENESLQVIDTSRGVAVIKSDDEEMKNGADGRKIMVRSIPIFGWIPSAPFNRSKTFATV